MKKQVMTVALALLTAGMCSCGKSETPVVTTVPQPQKAIRNSIFLMWIGKTADLTKLLPGLQNILRLTLWVWHLPVQKE